MLAKTFAPQDALPYFSVMRGCNVLVVGDIMVDEWIWGVVNRISPEAPVPVVAVNNHSFTLGGAGNVVNNLRTLGARVSFAGVIGEDVEGDRVLRLLEDLEVDHEHVIRLSDRPTTRKTRIVAHNQQVVRADWESTREIEPHEANRLYQTLKSSLSSYDAVVLSDYAKGLFSRQLVEIALQVEISIADPKPRNFPLFAGVTCVAPNVNEAGIASGIDIVDDASLEAAGALLLERLACTYVVITRGEHGMRLFGKNGLRHDVPSVARTVFDVSGAGDTVVAMLTLALAANAPIERALELANVAAGAVVEKLGTATATPDEILTLLEVAYG